MQIISYICGAVNHLACDNKENKKKFRIGGICEYLMYVIRSVRTDVNTLLIGCEAIKNLCENDYINCDIFGCFGICTLIMSIMNEHMKDSAVVTVVFEVVKAITDQHLGNRLQLGNKTSCRQVTDALHHHKSNCSVIDVGCSALRLLLLGIAENDALNISYIFNDNFCSDDDENDDIRQITNRKKLNDFDDKFKLYLT